LIGSIVIPPCISAHWVGTPQKSSLFLHVKGDDTWSQQGTFARDKMTQLILLSIAFVVDC
jgi:hypothetical protein